jgi:PilZ domain
LQFTVAGVSVPAFQQGLEELMDNPADRREARRFTMNLPLSILPSERAGNETAVNLRDVSYRGLYFFASEPFEAGREIAFVITLPKDLLKSSDVKIRCTGTVVRVDPAENGNLGIAAKIDRYEFVPCIAA